MERPVKISVKVQRIPGALSRVSIQNFNHLQVYFCGIIPPLTFFDRGAWPQVCNTCTCTQKISYFHVIPEEGGLSLSTQEKSIMFSGGKKSSFQIIQEISCPSAALSEKTSFQDVWKKEIWFSVQCLLLTFGSHLKLRSSISVYIDVLMCYLAPSQPQTVFQYS